MIFIDTTNNGEAGSVKCQSVSAEPGPLHFSHILTPDQVLAICADLYSARPHAFLISIHGECFDHGQNFSPATIQAVPRVVAQVRDLLKDLGRLADAAPAVAPT